MINPKYMDFSEIKKLANIVKLKKHTVLILIDGMGSNLIDILKKSSLLKRNKSNA